MSTQRYRYAIIGTGRPWKSEGATGFGMAHSHYKSFAKTERTDLVAIADTDDEHAQQFLQDYESNAKHYTDYKTLLAEEKPDIVSVTLWPHLHAEMTVAACEAGVKAVHCEKPMATTWGDAKRMKAAAEANGTILTFNHQRRFLEPFQEAKRLCDAGHIGSLVMIEATCGDLYDWGTHWLDMLFFLNNETPAEWAIGQIDSRKPNVVFGADMENQGIVHFKWQNDVRGLLITGHQAKIGCAIRLVGSDGLIEVLWDKPSLRIKGKGDTEWRYIEDEEGIHGDVAIDRACADLIKALDEPGYKPLLSVDNAIQSTEVIFAAYESSRWRGRIEFPLQANDSALLSMRADGSIGEGRK